MDTFIFDSYQPDLEKGSVDFFYTLVHRDEKIQFKETLTFIPPKNALPPELIANVLDSLHIALGISYWKLYCPKKIELPDIRISKEQANFWNKLYGAGLGEFYFKNNIDFKNLVSFPFEEGRQQPINFPRQNRSLVGIGGGKDTIVTGELLKQAHKDFSGFSLNPISLQKTVADIMGVKFLSMKRTLDSQLFELNKRANVYNGHIPISAIYAFVSVFAALLYDFSYVIVSNEKSANYGNVEYLGTTINHQWSKSEEFENLFNSYVKNFITPSVTYFSLLRPLYEIKITELFTKYPHYFGNFTSCNTNFKQNHNDDAPLWCKSCAKCAFVFALLAAFLPKETVTKIFGQNLFEKEDLLKTYRELLGLENIKPFDCVGTPDEVKLAFTLAKKRGGYSNDVVMNMFEKEIGPTKQNGLLNISPDNLPNEFKGVLPL